MNSGHAIFQLWRIAMFPLISKVLRFSPDPLGRFQQGVGVLILSVALAGPALAQANSANPAGSQRTGASAAQKSQTASAAPAATGQGQSSGTDTTFNSIIGTINALVNKSSTSSSGSDNSAAKPGKTGGGKATAQADKTDTTATEDVGKSLAELKDLYERGLITKPEYDGKRKELIAKIH
jgi:hypothetical protein